MKITCPKCNAAGNIPDHEIPEAGRFLSCPRCKHGFDVKKPKATTSEYAVDVCPSCAYSTFGDERFSTCPKCGVVIKAFIERQREDMAKAREQELLTRKFSRDTAPTPNMPMPSFPSSSAPSPAPESKSIDIGEMIENLHPVNLIGWGCGAVAAVIVLMGLMGMLDYYGEDIRGKLSAQREEAVSAMEVFLRYGLLPWVEVLYGGALLAVSVQFAQHRAQARQALSWCLWVAIAYVPVTHLASIISLMRDAIPHPITNYLIEFFNMLFMSALVGIPLFLLIRFLDDRRITSIVRL
jgi:predicted Zn finger-like uncharacterized protein